MAGATGGELDIAKADLGVLEAARLLKQAREHSADGLDKEAERDALGALQLFRDSGNHEGTAEALREAASARCNLERPDEALELARGGAAELRRAGDRRALAVALMAQAEASACCVGRVHCEQAVALATEARDIFRSLGDKNLQATVDLVLVDLHNKQRGDRTQRAYEALHYASEAEDIFQAARDYKGEGLALQRTAAALFAEAATDAWLPAAKEAVELLQVAGDLPRQAAALSFWARCHLLRGEPRKALRPAEEALALRRATCRGSIQELRPLDCLVRALTRLDQPERALQEATEAHNAFQAAGEQRGVAASLELQAVAHLAAGDCSKALRAAEQALKLFGELRDSLGESRTLRTIAAVHVKQGKLDMATTHAERAVSTALDSGDVDEASRALREHTQLLLASGKPREAAAVATRLRQAFRGTGENAAEATALLSAADIHWSQGEVKQCLAAAREAVQLLEGEVDPYTEAAALALCAKAQLELKDFHQARQYGRRARRHFAEAGDKQQEASMRLLVGRACLMPDQRGVIHLKDALREAEEALTLAAELSDRSLEAAGLTLAAQVYNVGSNAEAAMDAADRASQIAKKAGDTGNEASARVACAEALLALNRSEEAWDEASRAVVLAEQLGHDQLAQDAQRVLEAVEQRLGGAAAPPAPLAAAAL